jgi:hypothetical protein
MLTGIKILHTVIWAVIVACILALPIAGVSRRFRWANVLSGVILVECAVLALNGGRCPLTDLAAKFTANRAVNFDIYLPIWLAQYNKVNFGALFVAGELVVLGCWWIERRSVRSDGALACGRGQTPAIAGDGPVLLCANDKNANA